VPAILQFRKVQCIRYVLSFAAAAKSALLGTVVNLRVVVAGEAPVILP
jgi:hypothetical protein